MLEPQIVPTAEPTTRARAEVVLSCTQVTKRYGHVTALDAVDLESRAREIVSVVGPSGSGKSSLLRSIAGLAAVDSGVITLADREVNGPSTFVPPERRRVGLVFQDLALFPHLTVTDNIAFGLRHGITRSRSRDERVVADRVAEMVRLVGLQDKGSRFPHELSGGEQQRVAIGRALATDPSLVLLDEPFSHLDRGLAVTVRNEAVAMLRSAGATVVLVTHDHDEALAVADRVAVMNAGRLVQVDTPDAVFHHPSDEFVASFLGEADFLAGRREGSVAHTALGPLPVDPGREGPVRVLLRPHHLTVLAATDVSADVATSHVVNVEFRGGSVLHVLRLESGESVRALVPHTAALAPGERAVVLPPDSGRLAAFEA